jgi:hypothetical protein
VSLIEKQPELAAEMDERLTELMHRYGDTWRG